MFETNESLRISLIKNKYIRQPQRATFPHCENFYTVQILRKIKNIFTDDAKWSPEEFESPHGPLISRPTS